MPRSHQGPQQVCKLLAQCRDIVSLRLEKLEERAQMGRGQRGITAVIGRLPVHQLVHASAEVFRVRQALIGFATQALTPRQLYAS